MALPAVRPPRPMPYTTPAPRPRPPRPPVGPSQPLLPPARPLPTLPAPAPAVRPEAVPEPDRAATRPGAAPHATGLRQLLSAERACALLDLTDPAELAELAAAAHLPAYRLGAHLRYAADDLAALAQPAGAP